MRFTNNYKDKIKKIVEDKNLTYYIDTMGCSMNENDSSKYAGILESIGFKREENEEKANLILFNTCCIRENAENTLFGRLGTLKKYKMNNENVYIVVVGCMTQQKHIIEKIKKSYRFVDITLGTGAMNSFPSKLYDLLKEKKKNIEFVEVTNEIEEEVPIKYDSKYKASVSIIYGCNNFCSYCIVPYVRGRERSRRHKDILNDVKKLAKEGYKEIMLLGQNVNSYGNDFKDTNYSFPNLLQDIEKIDGIEIIRFMSPHPKDFSDELIDVIKSSKKIARQIHLPLQSGSSKILKEMNRKHTKEDYLKIVNKLKNADENIKITFEGSLANVPADNLEICVLFNNMIDIAFENVKEFCGNGKQIIALKAETRAGFLFCCISFPIENEIKKAQNNVLYHSFAYKTLKNLAEKNGGKIETSLSDDRLAITTGWVINNFS